MKRKVSLWVVLLIVVSLIPLVDLFHEGLPITHDGQDHVARIANFYQNLQEGNIVPRWAEKLNWGYGHPILMFLYPLPSYLASLFHFAGFFLVDSTKIVFAVTFLMSGLTMYLWIKNSFGEKEGVLASVLYMFAPYRFVDLYVRGAIGEHVAFVFPPLIFYFLLHLSKRFSHWFIIGGAFSFALLILSHNAISLMFLPLILLYSLYLLWQTKEKKRFLFSFLMVVVIGLLLSSFFWIPAFLEGRYTLRDIVTKGEYESRFVSIQNLLYGDWNYGISGQFSTQLGIMHWFFVVISLALVVFLLMRKSKLWVFVLGSLFVFFTTLFLMTSYSKVVWNTVTTLQKFQFPWRLLSVSVFLSSILGAAVLSLLPKKKEVVTVLFVIVILWFNRNYWHANGYLIKDERFFTSVYPSTTDTGESSPIWSVRFMEEGPKVHMEAISGEAKIKELKRTSTQHVYEIVTKERIRLRENTLYFPGWKVFIDGKEQLIEFQDPSHRGVITFFLDRGEHTVSILFTETKLRFFANMISVATIILLASFRILEMLWRRFR